MYRMYLEMIRVFCLTLPFFFSFTLTMCSREYRSDCNYCLSSLSDFADTFYATVLAMVNIVDIDNYRGFITADNLLWYLVHLGLIFFLAILVMNLMIAIMVSTYDRIKCQSEALIEIERLRMCYSVIFGWHHFPRLYDRIRHKFFHCEDGRTYVINYVQRD